MKRIGRLILIVCIVISFVGAPSYASQYGTNFKFKDLKEMKEDGWSISNEKGAQLSKNGIILDGSKGVTVISLASEIPKNVIDWKVGATCMWLGGSGHSWLNVQVNTHKHQYIFALDGASGKFVLLRDNVKVVEVKGYREVANQSVSIYMDKNGNTVTLSCNSQVVGTYKENDASAVGSVSISSPVKSAALYQWAGAFIPEASVTDVSNNAILDDSKVDETEQVEVESDFHVPLSFYPEIDTNTWVQSNPGDDIDVEALSDDEQIPPPSVPEEEGSTNSTNSTNITNSTSTPNNNSPIYIVVNLGTFTINTEEPKPDYGGEAEASQYIFDGVCQNSNVNVAEASSQIHCEEEHHLVQAGLISPETSGEYNPFGGNKPSYYVTINTHISGNFETETTSQAAVGIFTAQITDANGQIIFKQKITATANQGHNVDYYHCQLAQQINSFLENAIKK